MAQQFEPSLNPEDQDTSFFEEEDELGLPESEGINVPRPNSVAPYNPPMLDLIATLAGLAQYDTTSPITDLSGFQTTVENAAAAIEGGGEYILRQQILNQEAAAETTRLRNFLIEGASRENADLKELNTLAEAFAAIDAKANEDKLEETALDRIENFAIAHPEQGDMLELLIIDEAEGGSVLGHLRNQLERSIILRREADKASKAVKDQSLGSDIIDILARMIPTNKRTSVDNLVESSMLDFSGTKILLARQDLFNLGTQEEFKEALAKNLDAIRNESAWIGENRQLIKENIHELGTANSQTENLHNFFDFIDFTLIAPSLKVVPALGKAVIARVSRNRELSRIITENTLQAEQDAVVFVNSEGTAVVSRTGSVEEAVVAISLDESMPTALKTTEQLIDGSVGLSDTVGRGLAANKQAADDVARALEQTPRLTEEELANAFDAAKANAIESHGEGAVIDFQVAPIEVRKGTFVDKFTMVLGRKDGIGYASKHSAERAAKRKGLLEFDIIQDADGLHYINIQSNINEAGYVHVLNEAGLTPTLFINTFLRSPSSFLQDVLMQRATSSVFSKGRVQRLLKPMMDNLKGLGRKDRGRVSAVLKRGNIEKKWYTTNEFISNYSDLHGGRMPSNHEVLAYYTVKDINDFDYILRNHAEYIKRATQGFITGEVKSANGITLNARNMKEIERIDDVARSIILDVGEGKLLEGRKIGLDVLKERMKTEGLKLFRVEGDDVVFQGRPLNHILVKKGDLAVKDLEYRQLKYSAGGHRLYDGKFFVKQAIIGATESGAKFVRNPRTHIVAPTKKTAQEWADRMNAARDAYRKATIDPEYTLQADRIIRDAGVEDGTEGWARLLDDGKLQDEPFQVTFDKELPRRHQETLLEDGSYDLTFEATGQRAYLEQQGQLYYSRKGNILKGPQDETAGLIDPFITATRAVENAASIASFTNYRVNAVQRWLKTYGDLLPPGDGLSPMQRFWSEFDVSKVKGMNTNHVNRAQSVRLAIQRQLGTQTKFGQAVRNGLRNLANWVEGPTAGGIRSKVAKKVLDLQDRDPVGAIKGFSFDLKLGLFDPSQLIIQTQTIAALVSLNPIRAPKFIFDGMLMRYAAVNQSDEMLKWVAKRSSMKPAEFESMVKTMRESGITDINGELILLDHTATAALGPVGSTTARVRDMGRIPFFEAERLNRIYAWRKSWDDLRSGVGTGPRGTIGPPKSVKELLTPDGKAELARRTDKFTMNMTSASAAFWQKGVLSIPTQFLSYQARLFENVLPIIGNKQWTASEKFRLAAGQMLLYGSVGIPGGRFVLDQIFKATGTEFDPDSKADQIAYRAYVGGFTDSMLYAITNGELDVAFSQRAAVGQAVTDFMEKISGGGIEEQSFLEVIGGAPFSVIGDVGSDAFDVVQAIARGAASESVSVTEMLPSLVTQMAVNVSSLSRMHRAYYVWKYGEWISQETGKTLAKATKTETIAAALGFQLRELADIGFANALTTKRKEFIKSQAKLISKLQLEAARLWRNDDREGWELKQREIVAWQQVLDPKDRRDVMKAARLSSDWRTTTEIMTDNFNQKYAPVTGSPELPAENTER